MNWRHWFGQLLVALDQLANVLITPGHSGAWADETLSSRAYRMDYEHKPWGRLMRPLIDGIMFWQLNHCRSAFVSERERLQSPPEER